MCIQWKRCSCNWVELKDLKESYPIEVARYSVNNNIQDESAFNWWVPYIKEKEKIIISRIKSKYWQRTHKYGIRIQKSVEEAYSIDEKNNNNY